MQNEIYDYEKDNKNEISANKRALLHRQKIKKQKRILRLKALAATLFALLFVACALLFIKLPSARFIIKDCLAGIGSDVILRQPDDTKYKTVSVEDFKCNSRVVFNQSLMLINADYPLETSFDAELCEYRETGIMLNDCAADAFSHFSEAVHERTDEELLITSAYRNGERQAEIKREEGSTAQAVGASEHQAGLGLDVCVQGFGGKAFLKTAAGEFVNSSCGDYGFIIRYPYYGKKQTGIAYEPWHIRYVGKPHSDIIMRNRITLEEYIFSLKEGEFYEYDGYIITRQSGETLKIPEKFKSAAASYDNTGGLIIAFVK